MIAQEIVDKLAATVPLYTSGFSESVVVQSITVAGTTATATTATDHGLVEGQNVAITGAEAPVQIDTGAFLRTGSTATFETLQDHDLTLSERDKANGGRTVRLSGAAEAEFIGEFQLLRVANRRKLVIAVADSGPTGITGSPLVDDANGGVFNGLVPAVNLTPNTFDYQIATAYPLPAVAAGATAQTTIRIVAVADVEEYLRDIYTAEAETDDTLIVQLGDVSQSKKRNEQTDASASAAGNDAFTAVLVQPFAVYVVLNATGGLTGAQLRDKVETEYVPAVFRAVLRARFSSGFSYDIYRATFTGHGVFAYSDDKGKNRAIYAHEITFEQLAALTSADAVDPDQSVAMRDVGYVLTVTGGTEEDTLNASIDLDEEPIP